jgi:hypothetical protein
MRRCAEASVTDFQQEFLALRQAVSRTALTGRRRATHQLAIRRHGAGVTFRDAVP